VPKLGVVGFPESVLVTGERLQLHCHPHIKRLAPAVVVLFAACALAGLAAGVVSRPDGSQLQVIGLVAIAVIWLVVVGWWSVRPWLRWRLTHFVVTDRRVAYRVGMLARRGTDIPMRRITAVEYRQNVLDRLFGCGTLAIESAGDEPVEFDDIPRVTAVHALLYGEAVLEDDEG
jgi:uncharacterized membrane protein YdbT with pleckstrin-like domain